MNRLYLLDIARGLAAITIGIFHYKIFYTHNLSENNYILENQPYFNYIRLIYEHGWIAVQFFFLLSGFIFFKLYLKKIFKKKISFYNFIVLRISRLYPLHFFTLIIVLLVYIHLENNNFQNPIRADLEHFIYNLFLIHEWGISKYSTFNEPSWSISVELFIYIIFFYLALKARIIFLSLLIIFLSSILFFKFKLLGYGGYCFFIGGISFIITENLKINLKNKILLLIIVIFISIFLLLSFADNSIFTKIIALTFFFPALINLLYLINNYSMEIGKKLSFIGDASYSFYLIHFPIILITMLIQSHLNLKINFNSNTIFWLYLITTFLISICSYKFVEVPLKKILRKKFIKNDK